MYIYICTHGSRFAGSSVSHCAQLPGMGSLLFSYGGFDHKNPQGPQRDTPARGLAGRKTLRYELLRVSSIRTRQCFVMYLPGLAQYPPAAEEVLAQEFMKMRVL